MANLTHSELSAKLAIDGAVAAIAGTVRGQLPIKPRTLDQNQRAEAGIAAEGDFLFYPIAESGVFFYTHGAFTTIWYVGAETDKGLAALDAAIKRAHPSAKIANDGAHKTLRGWGFRTYDIKLPNGRLAIVEAAYPMGRVEAPKFSVRITSMAIKN